MTEKVGLVKSWSFLDKGQLDNELEEPESSIILGYLSDEIATHADVDPYTTKVGGLPNWLGKSGDANLTPLCEICGKESTLVLQAYSPLEVEAPDHHRVLYVFVCASPAHKNNWWHVIRSQIPVPPEELEQLDNSKQNTTQQTSESAFKNEDNWGAESDDWGGESDWNQEDEASNKDLAKMIEQRAQEIQALNSTKDVPEQPKQKTSTQKETTKLDNTNFPSTPHFIPYYLEVDEEPDESVEKKLTKKEAELLKQYESLENIDPQYEHTLTTVTHNRETSDETWNNEEYESVALGSSDKIFLKFQRRLARSPEQCLRYCFGGEPIWMTDQVPKEEAIPDCPYCGAKRIFELQLLPTLLSLKGLEWRVKPTVESAPSNETAPTENGKSPLQLLETTSRDARVDFGIVSVYSCSDSCHVEGMSYKKEWVFIQDSI